MFRDAVLVTTVAAGVATYDDTAAVGETDEAYTLKHVTAGGDSVASNQLTQWTGPDQPPTLVDLTSAVSETWNLSWTNGDATLATEAHLRNITDAEAYALRKTEVAGVTSNFGTEVGDGGDTVGMNVRHKKTTFAVDDFSAFSGDAPLPQTTELTVVLAV